MSLPQGPPIFWNSGEPDVPTTTNRQIALAQYRLRARFYDAELAAFEPVRHQAIDCLQLQPGDTVLDMGCGTGLSFDRLQQRVGPEGRVVGIEQSPEMAEIASQRVAQHAWHQVTLVNASVEQAVIPVQADAVLFHFTHDILQHPGEIRRVVGHLKPGARVVAAGLQWSSPWDWSTNWAVFFAALYSTSSLVGLGQPWGLLAEQVGDLQTVSSPLNGVYIVSGIFVPKEGAVVHGAEPP
jgi:SAM-dependent methyltransferase